jgi:four helix bundle protein
MKDYKELQVWQKAVSLVTETYKRTRGFPSDEKFGLTSQIRRSVTSVPANIAEGWGRGSTKDYVQFLIIARGSLLELETHLIVSRNLGYLGVEQLESALLQIAEIGRMLNSLIRSLRSQ